LVPNDAIILQDSSVLTYSGGDAGAGFAPALQREDGSYIGTDGYMNLMVLGLDGSVLWQQAIPFPAGRYNGLTPPLIPLYATADGGVGKKPCVFQPNGQEPQNCGGE
jgi:hypothetical protein